MNWPLVKLSDVCEINIGKTPSRANSDYWGKGKPWLSIRDMNQGAKLFNTKEEITDIGVKESNIKLVPKGTVLFSFKLSIGKIGITQRDMYTNEAIAALPVKNRNVLFENYLVYALSNINLEGTTDRAVMGSTLNKEKLKEIKIPLPPLEEQKRIAAILDKADAVRCKRKQAIDLSEQLLGSVFLDMFGDPTTNPKCWDEGTLGDIIHFAKDGPHVSPKYSDDGIPFLSTRHIKQFGVIWDDLKYISSEEAERQWKKCKPQFNDILYTKGGTTGIAAHVNFDDDFAIWVHVALLRPKVNIVNPIWLTAMLNTKYCYSQSQSLTHGATNKDLGLKRMIKIKMYIPPIEKQEKYAEFYKHLNQHLEKSKDKLTTLDNLFHSLVQKAFRGELSKQLDKELAKRI
ncbi:restriction endonuclease subunit S [Legionella bozemanae]|uniref:restriction endonuclease subunit S n=1 Tax=Legionella bozemanae TaxID=447 RepID=UPI00399D4E83